VIVNGRDVSKLSDRDASAYRLREVGFVLQTFHLIAGLSAIDNAILKLVATGLRPEEACQRITPLLASLEVEAQADRPVRELSMGEGQRIAIAKALSTDPALLLTDEPTGNLDVRRGRLVLSLLSEVARERGTAVVLVTHDREALGFADRAYMLRDGKLRELAEDELIAEPTLEAR
jgi:ABC-type lipoprotein export system ATPase subunit